MVEGEDTPVSCPLMAPPCTPMNGGAHTQTHTCACTHSHNKYSETLSMHYIKTSTASTVITILLLALAGTDRWLIFSIGITSLEVQRSFVGYKDGQMGVRPL